MKIFSKRIAFCISDQHTIPHGGLGQFAKSFVETFTPMGFKIDIICDKSPSNLDFKRSLIESGASFIYPSEPITYSKHSKIFMFEDSYNFEKMINFRDAMMQALNTNLYDTIICNTLESFPAVHSLSLQKSIQVIYYTHNESMVFLDDRTWRNEFSHSFNNFFNVLLSCSNIQVGTQTERNKMELLNNRIPAYLLPIPMTEKSLLNKHIKSREGVLWIGRWEPRKNPEEFIRVIQETKLPAKVITNTNGAKKFEQALTEICADFQIKIGVYGKEKVDFLTSARVAYNPAIRESFGLAFYETAGHMPTVVLENMSWIKNFPSEYYYSTTKKDASEKIKTLYEIMVDGTYHYEKHILDKIIQNNQEGIQRWVDMFDNFIPSKSDSDRARINQERTVCYKDFIKGLNRKDLSIDDIKSVLTNKHKYNTIYTNDNTYLSKDKNFIPNEKTNESASLEDLFA